MIILNRNTFLFVAIILLSLACNTVKKKPCESIDFCSFIPVVDGELEQDWSSYQLIILKNYNLGRENIIDSFDLRSNYRMIWDTNSLYIFIQVVDDKKFDIRKIKQKIDVPFPYNCDCVELFFNTNNNGIDKTGSFQIQDYDSRYSFVYISDTIDGEYNTNNGIQHAYKDTKEGYNLEILIPFSTISFDPTKNISFGFEISVNDNDLELNLPFFDFSQRSMISWSQNNDIGSNAWQNTGLYGTILLKK